LIPLVFGYWIANVLLLFLPFFFFFFFLICSHIKDTVNILAWPSDEDQEELVVTLIDWITDRSEFPVQPDWCMRAEMCVSFEEPWPVYGKKKISSKYKKNIKPCLPLFHLPFLIHNVSTYTPSLSIPFPLAHTCIWWTNIRPVLDQRCRQTILPFFLICASSILLYPLTLFYCVYWHLLLLLIGA
jgi:hypothetical protein